MKIWFHHRRDGLSLIDVLIIVATLASMATLFLLVYPRHRISGKNNWVTCVNNLRQIGLAFRIYAGDNQDRYPMNISTNSAPIVNETTAVYQYLKLTENELGTPKILICPKDPKRVTAPNFTNFSDKNISYFIGLDSDENLPASIFAGDRNITNGIPPKGGILRLATNQMAGFTKEMHIEQGSVAMGDGSVQRVSSARLRSDILPNTGFETNRIILP